MPFTETQSDRYLGFELIISGRSFQVYNHLEGFQFGFGQNQDQKANIELYTPDWDEIIDIAKRLMVDTRDISFRFGWNDRLSREYQANVLRVVPNFEQDGATLAIEAQSKVLGVSNFNVGTSSWDVGTKPSDIAREVAETLGFKDMIIEESDPWTHGPLIMDKVHMFKWLRDNFANLNAKKPVTANGGQKSGYTVHIDGAGRFHFHTRLYNQKDVVRSYTYAKGKKGQVLSFEPRDDSNIWALFFGTSSETISVDTRRKEYVVKNASDDATQAEVVDGKAIQKIAVSSDVCRRGRDVHREPEAVNKSAKSGWGNAKDFKYGATLTILGDPFIDLNDLVQVVLLSNSGSIFPLSGIFQVLSVSHQLDGSGFTTTLELFKQAMLTGKEELGSPKIIKKKYDIGSSVGDTPGGGTSEKRLPQNPATSQTDAQDEINDRIAKVHDQRKGTAFSVVRSTTANVAADTVNDSFDSCMNIPLPTITLKVIREQVYEAVQKIINGVVSNVKGVAYAQNIVIESIRSEFGDFGTVLKDHIEDIFNVTYLSIINNQCIDRLVTDYGPLDNVRKLASQQVFYDCAYSGISSHIDDLDAIFPGIASATKTDISTLISDQLSAWLIIVRQIIECAYGTATLAAFDAALTQPVTDGVTYVSTTAETSIDSFAEQFIRAIVNQFIQEGVTIVEEALA